MRAKGLPEALKSVFPDTEVQLCIIHMIRNSIKYVPSKHVKEFLKDLKEIYLWDSKMTDSGVEALRKALPDAKVIF